MKVNGVRKFIYSGKLNFTMVVFFFIQKTELGFAIDFEMYFSLKWKEIVCTVFFFVYIEKKNAVLVTCGPTYE